MRVRDGFELREVAGECIVVATGVKNVDFNRIVVLNPSAAYLWRSVAETEFTVEELAGRLTERYEVEPGRALADSRTLVKQWLDAGIIE